MAAIKSLHGIMTVSFLQQKNNGAIHIFDESGWQDRAAQEIHS